MPAELFRPAPVARRRAWLLPLSIAAHGIALAAVFITPLVAEGELPDPARATPTYVLVTDPPMPPAPKPPGEPQPKPTKSSAANPDAAPLVAPPRIAQETNPTLPGVDIGFDEGSRGGVDGVVPGSRVADYVPPAPEPRKPMRVGGDILAPKKIHDVAPKYPVVAQQARIEGAVIIEAVIGADGRVLSARSLRPMPFLEEAALEAVRQWVFTPTRLNGEAIPVVMTVTVSFQLR
jgi:protein TonB